jgi:hypothetical protein
MQVHYLEHFVFACILIQASDYVTHCLSNITALMKNDRQVFAAVSLQFVEKKALNCSSKMFERRLNTSKGKQKHEETLKIYISAIIIT